MKIQFLGTGAADWPDPGKIVGPGRRESSLIVEDRLMIDCGRMTMAAIDEFGVDVDRVEALFISHPHDDHFGLDAIAQLVLRRDPSAGRFIIAVDAAAAERAASELPREALERIAFRGFVPGDSFYLASTLIETIPANHVLERPDERASHAIVTIDQKRRILYAPDGAWFLRDAWRAVQGKALDVVIWELTCGNLADWRLWGHCNLGMLKLMTDAFRTSGAIQDYTVMFCTHLARTLCPPHELYARELKASGFILARDGMVWEG